MVCFLLHPVLSVSKMLVPGVVLEERIRTLTLELEARFVTELFSATSLNTSQTHKRQVSFLRFLCSSVYYTAKIKTGSHIRILSSNCTFDTAVVLVVMFII